jgi:hypothetical protein
VNAQAALFLCAYAMTHAHARAVWVWRAHDEVNERLAKIEAKYGHSSTGDAAFPKVWPSCSFPQLPVVTSA